MKNTLNQLKTFIVLGIVGTIDHQVHYYIESLLAKDKKFILAEFQIYDLIDQHEYVFFSPDSDSRGLTKLTTAEDRVKTEEGRFLFQQPLTAMNGKDIPLILEGNAFYYRVKALKLIKEK